MKQSYHQTVSCYKRAMSASKGAAASFTLRDLLAYFLWLGSSGFGGPIALVGYMQRDLVERRGWFTERDYSEGLALAQLAPGPLAAQLAIYLGWLRSGTLGATLVAAAFILPSFAMVLVISALYLRFGGLPWMEGAFYGVGAAVIAIIVRSAWKLMRSSLRRDPVLWTIFLLSAGVTAWTESEIVWLFLLCGVAGLLLRGPARRGRAAAVFAWPLLLTGLYGAAEPDTLWRIAWYFAEAGAFVFGSGLAIVPFLHGGVVNDFHWLSEQQFLDAVAVAMITPGPVVITVAFIGYLVAGPLGACVAAVGVFLPCYLFVVIPATYFRKAVGNASVRAFVEGVTAAATGAIAGAAFVLGKRAIVELPTAAIALAALAAVIYLRRVPEPLVIVAAGLVGFLAFSLPAQAGGPARIQRFDFEDAVPHSLPAGFSSAHTGAGGPAIWEVQRRSSPGGAKVLIQTSSDRTNARFPLCILDSLSARDVDLSVRFEPISGEVDRAAGLVFRYRDAANYYVVRANALEGNVVLYKVESGKRSDLKALGGGFFSYGMKTPVPSQVWSTLQVVARASHFAISLNGAHLFDVEDQTFPDPGKVGLWTKADSVTAFDDLRVEVLDAMAP